MPLHLTESILLWRFHLSKQVCRQDSRKACCISGSLRVHPCSSFLSEMWALRATCSHDQGLWVSDQPKSRMPRRSAPTHPDLARRQGSRTVLVVVTNLCMTVMVVHVAVNLTSHLCPVRILARCTLAVLGVLRSSLQTASQGLRLAMEGLLQSHPH